MKRELPHYQIGSSYGSCQDWFLDPMMNRGGCGAITACDSCIYFAKYMGRTEMYPFDPDDIGRRDFILFGRIMKPFLSPRRHGIDTTKAYMDGFSDYLRIKAGTALPMRSVEGNIPFEEARDALKEQIDAGIPVAYLMLLHRDREFDDYQWHWFLVNGYEERENGFFIKAVTYSAWRWLDMKRLWDTGYEEKGGFVLYEPGPVREKAPAGEEEVDRSCRIS